MALPELLARLDMAINTQAVADLERLVDELLHWNLRRNLTAIKHRDEALEKHLVDSLTLLPFARLATRLLDIGSGAGFPALPLKIACPALSVVSVDAVGKKIDFQKHMVRLLGLTDFMAVHGRIEALADKPGYRRGFDLVTARAFCPLAELVATASPFLAPEGRLVAMKGPEGDVELNEQRDCLERAGWTIRVQRLTLPESGAGRCLVELTGQR